MRSTNLRKNHRKCNHVRAKKRHVQNLYADRIEQLNEYLTQPS